MRRWCPSHKPHHPPDHLSFRMSRQMLPYWSTLGWKQGVSNRTVGGLNCSSRAGRCYISPHLLLRRPPGKAKAAQHRTRRTE